MNERTLRTLEFTKVLDMLASRAATNLGKERCLALEPSSSHLEVQARQTQSSEARRLMLAGKSIPLGGIHDLRVAVARAAIGGILEPSELLDTADTIASGRRLRKFLQEEIETAPGLAAVANLISGFNTLEAEIRQSITDHGEVADDASPDLHGIRKQMRVAQSRIRERLDALVRSSSMQKYLQESIVTVRDDRYVVPVKIEYRSQVPGIIHDQSASGSTLFVEPQAVVELNNEMKQLALQERAEIARILRQLSALVAQEHQALQTTLSALGEIDFAAAKGKLSLDLDCVEPELTPEPMLDIKRGRHPLLKGKVVPLDVHLGRSFHTLVVTGPNTGGKTVTLKTMGLFVLMTQCGLHLPAGWGTTMGIFEQVFVDVGDEQSIEQSLSTFSSHMTNLVRILDELDGKALILVDELGAGTDPSEGAALAMSILDHLHARGARTIATTHYSELKTFAYSRPGVENASVEFDPETLQPTYRLLIGMPGRSNAFAISQRLGLPAPIVQRAKSFISQEEHKIEDMIAAIHQTRRELDQEQEQAQIARVNAQKLKAEWETREARAREKEQEILAKARDEANRLVAQVRRESDEITKQLKDALARARQSDQQQALHEAKDRIAKLRGTVGEATAPTRPAGPGPQDLRAGEEVVIISLDTRAFVITTPDEQGNVFLQAGILKVTRHLSDLARPKEAQKLKSDKVRTPGYARKEPHSAARVALNAARTDLSMEVDLRGLLVDEALDKVDKYLDDALLAGMPSVRIIHGKGTGALRAAVQSHLKGHRGVKSYRLGGVGEGSDGVTVAELRD